MKSKLNMRDPNLWRGVPAEQLWSIFSAAMSERASVMGLGQPMPQREVRSPSDHDQQSNPQGRQG